MALTLFTAGGYFDEANSFGSLDDADTYHDLRANTAWAESGDDAKEAAMVRAYDYLTNCFSWIEGTFETTVPTVIKNAQYEAALRELATPGCLQPDLTQSDYVLREKIDVIETEYGYHKPGTQFKIIQSLIAPYVRGSSGSIEIVRG